MSTAHEIPSSLKTYLDEQDVPYQLIAHSRELDAQRTAAVTHTPGAQFAKCLLVKVDDSYALVVLPADHKLDLPTLRKALMATWVGLVDEEEMQRVFPDCELGAEPPLGELYGIPVYVASAIASAPALTFNAGTHEEAIRMAYGDFEKLAQPTAIDCSVKVHG